MGMLEYYLLGLLRRPQTAKIEKHLRGCFECWTDTIPLIRNHHAVIKEVLQFGPEIHATDDGLIYQWVEPLADGGYRACRHGPNLNGGGNFLTERRAWAYLRRSFLEMFPEHRC